MDEQDVEQILTPNNMVTYFPIAMIHRMQNVCGHPFDF